MTGTKKNQISGKNGIFPPLCHLASVVNGFSLVSANFFTGQLNII